VDIIHSSRGHSKSTSLSPFKHVCFLNLIGKVKFLISKELHELCILRKLNVITRVRKRNTLPFDNRDST
jgi:hypothetical protein